MGDEFIFIEFKALVERVLLGLRERGMLVFDAFRAINSSNSGLISCSELYGGCEFLGISVTPEQIYAFMRRLALHNEGMVSYDDFKRVFGGADDEFESNSIGAPSNFV